ncbi:hypothetical protein F66182_8867 [Fusarium sp. NRRL 66182]|nr:hypothetical protein F66182_8867 [Fusarium sp. NRRL 66182]
MSDSMDQKKMAGMADISMADLCRLRQEELPLSHQERRGPSYRPVGRNGTDHIPSAVKEQLKSKWTFKLDDEEARQMEGLEHEDARPWAYKQTRQLLNTNQINSMDNTPTLAQWGPSQSTSTPPTEPPAAKEAVAPPRMQLVFTMDPTKFDPNVSECIVGEGNCYIVPGKNEALRFITTVILKIHNTKGEGILELHNDSKGDRIHDALDIDNPVLDDQYCVVKVNTMTYPYHLRFDTLEETKKFKRCLTKLKKSVRLHHKETTQDVQEIVPEVEAACPTPSALSITQDPALMATEQPENLIAMDGWDTVQSPQDIQASSIQDLVQNDQASALHDAAQQVSVLISQVLNHFSLGKSADAGAIAGIEDAIFEKWTNEGFLKDCNEKLKQVSLELLRSTVKMQMHLHSHLTGQEFPEPEDEKSQDSNNRKTAKIEGGDNNVPSAHPQGVAQQQQNGSVSCQEHGVTKGLSSSRFATKPVTFQGSFTGPRIHRG